MTVIIPRKFSRKRDINSKGTLTLPFKYQQLTTNNTTYFSRQIVFFFSSEDRSRDARYLKNYIDFSYYSYMYLPV